MTLTIVVCVTSVVDDQTPVEIERGALVVEEAAVPRLLNPADANAVETALMLRDAGPGPRVVAVSVGPAFQEVALRQAIAQGVDEAVRLWDEAFVGSDCLGIARALAAAAQKTEAGLVVCGELSVDGNGGLTGAMLAELLGATLVDRVAKTRFDGDCLQTERRAKGGYRIVERTPLPLVLTVATGANVPRYPTLRSRLRSRSVEIPCWEMREIGLNPDDVGEAAATLRTTALRRPPPDPRGLVDPGSDLPPEERWQMAVSGGVQERGSALVEGSPDELAKRVLHHLGPLVGTDG